MTERKNMKLKIAIVISILSLIIAVLSFGFSVYKYIDDKNREDVYLEIQLIENEITKGNIEFEQNYKKILLAEQSLMDQMDNCEYQNENALNNDLYNLIKARKALIEGNVMGADYFIRQIIPLCADYEAETIRQKNPKLCLEVATLSLVWVLLLASIVFVLVRRVRSK